MTHHSSLRVWIDRLTGVKVEPGAVVDTKFVGALALDLNLRDKTGEHKGQICAEYHISEFPSWVSSAYKVG